MKLAAPSIILFICLPLFAQAGAYKCKQPNGSVSFQEAPCPANAESSSITLPRAAATDSSTQPAGVTYHEHIKLDQETRGLFDNCMHAMDHWNAVKAAKNNRAGDLAAAEKQVADACN
ncbi:MAG TPA: DUF4124 domain-containing protein [Burkholderiaceae bacterium]|nr:DUF4124 domain-containing protein [Burkholderiaceae bacterium]